MVYMTRKKLQLVMAPLRGSRRGAIEVHSKIRERSSGAKINSTITRIRDHRIYETAPEKPQGD